MQDSKVNYWMFLSHFVTFCLVTLFYYLTVNHYHCTLAVFLFCSLSLSFSPLLCFTHTHTHTHTLSLSHTHTHTHTHSLTHTISLSLSLSLTHTHTHTYMCTLSPFHSLSLPSLFLLLFSLLHTLITHSLPIVTVSPSTSCLLQCGVS